MGKTSSKDSYRYRPGENAHQAINAIKQELNGKYDYVVEADIKATRIRKKGFEDNLYTYQS